MHRYLALALTGLLASSCSSDDLVPEGCDDQRCDEPIDTIGASITAYDYRFDISTSEAVSRLDLLAQEAGDCIRLPFRADAPTLVTLDDQDVVTTVDDGFLTACGARVEAGDRFTLESHHRVPQVEFGVGYSVATDQAGATHHHALSWIEGCDVFGPCDTATDAFATYKFSITHPDDFQVVCPGVITRGIGETECRFDLEGGPSYSTFGFLANNSWDRREIGQWGGVDVVIYDTEVLALSEEIDGALHDEFLHWIQGILGPYPYGDELRIIAGPMAFNGFEHPGNIAIADHMSRDNPFTPLTHTLNHEIVHQWAGNQTTLASNRDFIWKEAVADYLVSVFDEEEQGIVDAPLVWKEQAKFAPTYALPIEPIPFERFVFSGYGTGSMVMFRQLEGMFGRAPILEALTNVLGEAGTLSVDELRLALEKSTGQELSSYFDTWLLGDGPPQWPQIATHLSQVAPGRVQVELEQVFPADRVFGCSFDVRLKGEGQELDVHFDLGIDGRGSRVQQVDVDFRVLEFELDPHTSCLVFPPE